MTTIQRTAIVPYTAEQMFMLVDSVEHYPLFVPGCLSSSVISRNEDEVHARLDFGKGGIHKSFTTCNRLQPHKMIEIRLVDGPFQQLEGFWRFDHLSADSCQVSLDLEFEFSNKLMGLAFGPIFHQVANTLVDAFSKRAHEVYGPK